MTGSVIVITSGKGGVGKTTTSANIGTALAKDGSKVVLIDTDIGLRNLDLLLGLENRIVYTIVDVVEERCKLKQALVKDKKNPNLCLLAAAQTRDKSAVTEEQLKNICEQLKEEFDYIIVDCPAGIEQGFQNAVAGANEAIVVTDYGTHRFENYHYVPEEDSFYFYNGVKYRRLHINEMKNGSLFVYMMSTENKCVQVYLSKFKKLYGFI